MACPPAFSLACARLSSSSICATKLSTLNWRAIRESSILPFLMTCSSPAISSSSTSSFARHRTIASSYLSRLSLVLSANFSRLHSSLLEVFLPCLQSFQAFFQSCYRLLGVVCQHTSGDPGLCNLSFHIEMQSCNLGSL